MVVEWREFAILPVKRDAARKLWFYREDWRDVCYANRERKRWFSFSFLLPFSFPLFPSPSGKKFERVESMKGVENKGTTIVEGTKTSSLKFQRLASLRRKKNKKKKKKGEKRKKHHVGTWDGEKKREIENYLVLQDVIFRRKLFSFARLFQQLTLQLSSSSLIHQRLSSILLLSLYLLTG